MKKTDFVNLSFTELGLIRHHPKIHLQKRNKNPAKRKAITYFSNQSSKRMKIKVLQNFKAAYLLGITLTLPVPLFETSEFKRIRRVFFQKLTRHFPEVYLIYRIELQKNKRPHIHFITNLLPSSYIEKIFDLWKDFFPSAATFSYACHVQIVKSSAACSYLIQHDSKRKKDQLGYAGRQWGEIGTNKNNPIICNLFIPTKIYIKALRLTNKLIAKNYKTKRTVNINQSVVFYYYDILQRVIKTLLNHNLKDLSRK